MKITTKTKICLIIGDPVEHSLSPAMHNAAYEALGIDDKFVFTAAHVRPENLKEAVAGVRVLGFRGLTCTIPHKVEVMKYLDKLDDTAKKIGAVNTVVNNNGTLTGYNTDWLGVITPIKKMLPDLTGKKAAVIGAGGASRAMVYGLKKEGATVKIFNRTVERAKKLAEEFNCEAGSIDDLSELENYDIILNSTSLGMGEKISESPVSLEFLNDKQIVFDAVYTPYETQLLKDAKAKGAKVIHGLDMLLHQGTAQFELYTGQKAPEEVMRKVLMYK